MKKQYLYIILAIVVVAIIGLIIYHLLNNNKNKKIDIDNISDKDVQKIVDAINIGDLKIDIKDFEGLEDSVALARRLGVPEEKIIKNIAELNAFMLN
jgi:hypothetical protein